MPAQPKRYVGNPGESIAAFSVHVQWADDNRVIIMMDVSHDGGIYEPWGRLVMDPDSIAPLEYGEVEKTCWALMRRVLDRWEVAREQAIMATEPFP
jgi:hypothetical protein